MSNQKTAVLISGGVDSAVAVHQLCEKGLKPDLFYIRIGMEGEDLTCTAEEDIELSMATARNTGFISMSSICRRNIGNSWWATPWSVRKKVSRPILM